MRKIEAIAQILEPPLRALGYDIIRISLSKAKRPVLQVMIECLNGESVTLDDCTKVSRTVSVLLEVEDPIQEAYSLEISSPGLDRPLTKHKDYERFQGEEVKLQTLVPLEGRKRFQGTLASVEKDGVLIAIEDSSIHILWDNIQQCRLVPYFEKEAKKEKLTKGKKNHARHYSS